MMPSLSISRHGPKSVFISGELADESVGSFVQKITVPVLDGDIVIGVLIVAINSLTSSFHQNCETTTLLFK